MRVHLGESSPLQMLCPFNGNQDIALWQVPYDTSMFVKLANAIIHMPVTLSCRAADRFVRVLF